jgi:hypothetical protein
MRIIKINFEAGDTYKWYNEEMKFIDRFLSTINDDVDTVVVREHWLTVNPQEFENNKRIIESRNTRLIKMCFLDAPVAETYSAHYNEVLEVGIYPKSKYKFNFIAYFFQKYFDFKEIDSKNISIPYMCLNGKPHHHRLELYENLKKYNLVEKGYVSLDSLNTNVKLDNIVQQKLIPSPYTPFSFGDTANWEKHFLNVVTETVFSPDECSYFLTEKTFKPVIAKRPFLLYAVDGGLKSLKNIGILPYVNDFNDISDLDLSKHFNIPDFLQTLSNQPTTYFQKKYKELKSKIEFNYNTLQRLLYFESKKYNNLRYLGK